MTSNPSSSQRLHYVDHLRSFAMLFGVLVHTLTLGHFGRLEWISLISHHFRMATFFVASGFFAVLLLRRRTLSAFFQHRMSALAIPLASSLLLLNTITIWLMLRHHNPGLPVHGVREVLRASFGGLEDIAGPINWHLHLWFLIALVFYVLASPIVNRLISLEGFQRTLDRIFARIPKWATPAVIALSVAASVVIIRLVYAELVRPVFDVWLVRSTMEYWPFFLLGMLLFVRTTEWERIHRIDPITIALAAAAMLLAPVFSEVVGDTRAEEAMRIFGLALARCAAVFALLALFRRYLDYSSPAGDFISDSIYTVYLFHFLVIYAFAAFVVQAGEISSMWFLAITSVTFAVTFAIHKWIIRSSFVLRLLFNGKY